MLSRSVPETVSVVGFEPIKGSVHVWIQEELGTILDEGGALLGVFHRAAAFHFQGPGLDFARRFLHAVGLQPSADLLIIRRGLNSGLKLLASDALEVEKHFVQRTIVEVFAQSSRQAGAALIDSAAGDDKSGDALAGTVRRLFGQVSGDEGGVHDYQFFAAVLLAGSRATAKPDAGTVCNQPPRIVASSSARV